jgi:hypothetical protein
VRQTASSDQFTLLNSLGVPLDSLGDSTGRIKLISDL